MTGDCAEFTVAAGPPTVEEARQHVITYLDWVAHDLARGRRRPSWIVKSTAPAARLLKIWLAPSVLLDNDHDDEF